MSRLLEASLTSSVLHRSVIAEAKTKLQGVKADAETLQTVIASGHQDLDREITEVREELQAKEMALKVLEERVMRELGEFRTFAEGEVERLRKEVEEQDRAMKRGVEVMEGEWQSMNEECCRQRAEFSQGMTTNENKIDQFGEKVRILKTDRETLALKLRAEVKKLETDIDNHYAQEVKEQRVIHERVCNEIERLKNQADRSFQEAEEKWMKDTEALDEFAINLAVLLEHEVNSHK